MSDEELIEEQIERFEREIMILQGCISSLNSKLILKKPTKNDK